MTNMNYVLFREKPTLILIYLLQEYTNNPKTMSWLSFRLNSAFSYVSKIIEKCKLEGIISSEKKGRIVELTLTKKGCILAQNLKIIWDKLEKIENKDIKSYEEKAKNGSQ